MNNLYLPKETIIKSIIAIILGIVTILKLFGIDVGVSEAEINAAVISAVDVVTFAILIYKNFITSRENEAGTKQSREAKAKTKKGDITAYDIMKGNQDEY